MDMLQTVTDELLDPQNSRLIKLNTGLPIDQRMLLNSFSGEETFSSLYAFNLELLSRNAHVELKDLLLQQFQLEIETTSATPRYISGYVTTAEHAGADEGVARYRVVLHPWMWFLTRRTNSRIFQDLSVDEIIGSIFGEYGDQASFEFRLGSTLPVLSYCTQYRETDFAFVQRLIERHGLFYWFEQAAEGHKLIVTDTSIDLPQLEAQPSVRFHRAQVTEEADSITQWSGARTYQPSRVSVTTFDYKYPGQDNRVEMNTLLRQGGGGELELFDYPGTYEYNGKPEGEQLARQHLEMLEANAKVFQGQGNVRALCLGRWFTLEGHYAHQDDPASERQFLVTSISHSGRNNYLQGYGEHAHYNNRFTCIRNHIPFRSGYTVSRPIVHGPQTAIVTGPEGEEIFTDELGRVKVQFHWDRYGEHNDQSSCWLRVATSSAGERHGYIRLPRIGEEVLVEFLDGSPDRPVITGSLYNGQNSPPWPLPDNKTSSGFRSQTHKGNGFNELRFEDKADQEFIYLHAQKNLEVHVKNSRQKRVEFDDTATIGNNSYLAVAKDRVESVDGNRDVTVVSNLTEKIDGERGLRVGGSWQTHAGGDITLKADGEIVLDASKITLVSGGAALVVSAGSVDATPTLNVGSATPGAAALPPIPAVLEAAAGEGSPFVSHCPLEGK